MDEFGDRGIDVDAGFPNWVEPNRVMASKLSFGMPILGMG